MAAIIIKSNSEDNLRLLIELAKKLGEDVTKLSEEQIEDISLGNLMKKARTGKNVSKETIMRQLRSK